MNWLVNIAEAAAWVRSTVLLMFSISSLLGLLLMTWIVCGWMGLLPF